VSPSRTAEVAVAETNARRAGEEFFAVLRRLADGRATETDANRARQHLDACLDDLRLAALARDEAVALNRPILRIVAGGRS
jgi:hypothetical protein